MGYWGNQYDAKNLTYYGVLYFHYLIGGLFFSFLGLGLLRDVIWKNDKGGNRQLTFLLAYSILIASVIAMFLVYRYTPQENGGGSTRQLEGPTMDGDAVVVGMEERP